MWYVAWGGGGRGAVIGCNDCERILCGELQWCGDGELVWCDESLWCGDGKLLH